MGSLDKRRLGRNIRQARRRRGLTQAQMAEAIDMPPEVYGQLERGHLAPRLERFVAICRALGDTPASLSSRKAVPKGTQAALASTAGPSGPMRILKRTLAGNVFAARKGLGLTQVQMAARLRMSVDVYGRLERGSLLPSLDGFVAICRVLGELSEDLLMSTRARKRRPKAAKKVS
jgi:transcriptional regulator with XRE-family HTH domain